LFNQATTVYSEDTFYFEITDHFEKGMGDIKARYPVLIFIAIQISILTDFGNPKSKSGGIVSDFLFVTNPTK
jgi:hypothetical protein